MLFIDSKFVSLLSSRLRNFKQKKDYLWNFSCPVCGDSSKNKIKARGYIYRTKSDLFVKCHNCGYGSNLGNFIKHLDLNLYDEYVVERYKSGAVRYNAHKDISKILPKETELVLEDEVLSKLQRIDLLDETHPAVQYCLDRKIPKDKLNLIYFCKSFKVWSNSIKYKFRDEENDVPRLVFPFFDSHGRVFAYSGRAFGKEEPKYILIKLDEDKDKIYGLERVNWKEKIYVVEGQIDSLFLPNCIAVAGASFDTPEIQKIKTNCVVVMDNEPRNKDIVRQLGKYIEEGYTVCMFPNDFEYKDINDMVRLGGYSVDEIVELINKNSYSGLAATLRFVSWKKIIKDGYES
jgi:transcription elongation factor Elf1